MPGVTGRLSSGYSRAMGSQNNSCKETTGER